MTAVLAHYRELVQLAACLRTCLLHALTLTSSKHLATYQPTCQALLGLCADGFTSVHNHKLQGAQEEEGAVSRLTGTRRRASKLHGFLP